MAAKSTHRLPGVKPAKPKKPRADFPLTPHNDGKWCKKIKGKIYKFGQWDDPYGALRQYVAELPSIELGCREPHDSDGKPLNPATGLTVGDAVNLFIDNRTKKASRNDLAPSTLKQYREVGIDVIKAFRRNTPITQLRPLDFDAYRHDLAKRFGPHGLKRYVSTTRMIFNYPWKKTA